VTDVAPDFPGNPGTSRSIGPISLVIPVLNEVKSLPILVRSIGQQSRPPDEIIIVDGGSTDGTVALARQLTSGDPRYRVIEAGSATPGRGRNIGIDSAGHDWIALTDAGIEPESTWLERLENGALGYATAEVVWGTYEPRITSLLDECAVIAYVAPRHRTPSGSIRGPSVASCLIHRRAYEAVGGFPDLRASEDLIFMDKLQEAGIKTAWANDALVWWSLPDSLGDTYRHFESRSEHNVLAGRQADWHHGVARTYVVGGVLGAAALLIDKRFASLLVAGVAARVGKRTLTHHETGEWGKDLNPIRLAGVAIVLFVIDAAMFVGWIRALTSSQTRLRRSPVTQVPVSEQ
jgi:glycosyltransferase involved in cell wall biosynthesis